LVRESVTGLEDAACARIHLSKLISTPNIKRKLIKDPELRISRKSEKCEYLLFKLNIII
jgi:hypothetical protein